MEETREDIDSLKGEIDSQRKEIDSLKKQVQDLKDFVCVLYGLVMEEDEEYESSDRGGAEVGRFNT